MPALAFEKRKFPRVDTSKHAGCQIRVFGVKGKPLVGKVVNISLGGVAFVSSYKNISQALKKYSTRVKIQLPELDPIEASTTLLRIRPEPAGEDCLFVMKLTDMNGNTATRLQKFISI
jgi:c-di-GMP-binding flagellar brake protein YcgR